VDIIEAASRFLREVDLIVADYRDIDGCTDKALRFLAAQNFPSEESK